MKYAKPISILTASTALLLNACTITDEEKLAQGAAVGAAVGAGMQILLGQDTKDVLGGAAVGAVVGGLVGNELAAQAAELEQSIGASGAQITNTGSQLIVTLPEAITFDVDSAFVRRSLQTSLGNAAQSMNNYPNTRIEVIGHTDNTGSDAYNQDLSLRRAQAVAGFLRAGGVNAQRIRILAMGERAPIQSNATPQGREQNRRVEVIITPNA